MDNDIKTYINQLIIEIAELKKELRELCPSNHQQNIKIEREKLYTNKDIRTILKVDERLIKKYRNEGQLTFYRYGDKYWYMGKDILQFLERNKFEAFA